MIKKRLLALWVIITGLCGSHAQAQSVYINTTTEIFQLSSDNKRVVIENGCGPENDILSIAVHRDTIYYSTWSGKLKRFRIGHPGSGETLLESGFVYNAMTVDKDGLIYVATDRLARYNPNTKELSELGMLPCNSSGDMIFYKGRLLLAGWDPDTWDTGIYELNITDPSATRVYMYTPSFFGLLSLPVFCGDSRYYGLLAADDSTKLVGLDLANKAVLGETGSFPATILDGASITESGVDNKIFITASSKKNPDNCAGDNGSILLNASSVNGPVQFTLLNTGKLQASGRFDNLGGGTFRFEIRDPAGCTADTAISLPQNMPLPGCTELFVPNAFSPNNDGRNDYFAFTAPAGFRNTALRVYGRWGNIVFSAKGSSFSWDGSSQGAKQPSGVYIYTLSYTSAEGETKNVKGTVTLIR